MYPVIGHDTRENRLLQAVTHSGPGFYMLVTALLAVFAWGAYAYVTQVRQGLAVTGMRDYISWGIYITDFVFFIGISHAGTLISAILRITGAEWRRPITRMAEAITAFALMVGAPLILVDMGRPDRLLNIIRFGRLQSPILWDVCSVTTYFVGSLLYLYIPMIPDMALLRDRVQGRRKYLYRALALGWRGTPAQREQLESALSIMAVLIIGVAVSVHTVVSWIFGMTARPAWHSTIFGPYFVVGAIFSGIASLLIAMAIFRRVLHLEEYITPRHFRNLGSLLLALNLIYIYFTLSEYLTSFYSGTRAEAQVLSSLFTGSFAPLFWTTIIAGFVVPALMLAVPRLLPELPAAAPRPVTLGRALRPVLAILLLALAGRALLAQPSTSAALLDLGVPLPLGWPLLILAPLLLLVVLPAMRAHPIGTTVSAAALVNVAMWAKRYLIIVPTLQNPIAPMPAYTATEWAHYSPTWVEWSITAGAFAAFILLYVLFAKLFPIVSIWETREGDEAVRQGVGDAVLKPEAIR